MNIYLPMRPMKLLYIVDTKVVIALSLEEGMLIISNCTKLWTVHSFGIDNQSLKKTIHTYFHTTVFLG